VNTVEFAKTISDLAEIHRDRPHLDEPEVVVRRGEHRLSVRYEILGVEYDVNNNRLEIVTGEPLPHD
jgi:hypothetical protein